MLNVNLDGQFFTQTNDPELLAQIAEQAGVDLSRLTIPADEVTAFNAARTRDRIRREIEPLAGDAASIQGTIADNVGYMLEKLGRLAAATISGEAAANAVMAEIADDLSPLLAGIDDGSVTLTHHVKGTANVIADAGTRATAVSAVLEANAAP